MIMTVETRITRRYLERKTKSELASLYLELCDVNARLHKWVDDLQSGMYVNCVYCGHRYGPSPETPVSMSEVLKTHISTCPDHPLSHMRKALYNYVEWAGAVHEADCPADDTCECKGKPVNEAVNEALRVS